jgi:hypothetical protein
MRALPVLAPISLAVCGGVYFGIFACGGHAWVWNAFLIASTIVGLAVVLGFRRTRPAARLALVGLAVVVFVLVEATAAPFYPSAPDSMQEFGERFIRTIERGAC